ncbi:integrase family protein [Xanthomonas sp. MUS 060]|uniref:tyrosine-type recombinase/integrase n=1 Tax=Xanthomonas sp. MUS 060 TaxID=1588031 RepID=UPI0009E5BF3C|nr:integrase family protein [Xanthomonas sp. MUS 060]
MAQGRQQLTARGLTALKPGEWANDTRPHGGGQLQARKLASGAIAFYFRYTAPGRVQERLPLGTELTLAEARARASELSKRYQAGDRDLRGALETEQRETERQRGAAEAARAAKSSATLGALLGAYVQWLKDDGKISARNTENAIQLHVKEPWPVLWNMPASDVSLDDLLPVLARVADTGKLREASKIRSYLRAAYAAAIRARQDARAPAALRALAVSSNPARDLATIESSSAARDRALSVAELRAYWKRIVKLPGAPGALLRFHLLTGGQRIAQLARMEIGGLDIDTSTVKILDGKGRRKKPRAHYVPLLPDAAKALQVMRGGEPLGPYLFTLSEGAAPATYDMLRNHLDHVVDAMMDAKELGGGRFTPGDLRRTIETRLAAAGQSQEVRGQLQSHGLGGVQNRHYDRHDYAAEKLAALKALHKLLTGKPTKVAQRQHKVG